MMRIRRTLAMAALFGFAVGVIWFTGASAPGQVVIQVQPGGGAMPIGKKGKSDGTTTAQFSAVKLIENTIYRDYIRASRDAIIGKAYNDAITALQKILDTKEDSYVLLREKNDAGQEISRWASAKFAASQLLGSMPDEGLDVYEQRFGAKAQAMLREAKETGNQEMLADAAHRYFHTKAGVEANERLATMLLDRSQFFLAALRFGRLFKLNPERYPVAEMTLFKAALSHRRSGDVKSATELWRKLEDRIEAKGGIRVGEQLLTLNQLRTFFQDDRVIVTFGLSDWPMIRGDKSNNAQAIGGAPLMDKAEWRRKLLMDNDPTVPDEGYYHQKEKSTIDQLGKILGQEGNRVAMPGFFPITANGYAIFRSYGDIRCVALREQKVRLSETEELTFNPGDTVWRTHMNGSAAHLLTESNLQKIVQPWLENYKSQPGFANLVFENTTIGAISSDHQYAYAVDDLAIPPPDNMLQPPNQWNGYQQAVMPEKIKPLVMENSLWAFQLRNGSSAWSLGRTNHEPRSSDHPKDEFADSNFLGAPISVGGKLYVLNEKHTGVVGDAELRLVCIDPNKLEKVVGGTRPTIVQPIQVLGMVDQRNRVTHAISRRINAVHLAYGEGILVCPTNAGEVLGVDLMSRSLAWAYPYRERTPTEVTLPTTGNVNPNQQFIGRGMPIQNSAMVTISKWKSTPPVIVDGKVVFTAPDADSLHCINLHDGTPRWKVNRHEGDVFFAGVVAGKALIVGRNQIRAISLDTGLQVWSLTMGDAPSGLGVACNNIYYQPLKKNEILAIDVEKGSIKAHNRGKDDKTLPGNLVFSDGMVLSLNPYELVAFPQLQARLEIAEREAKAEPTNFLKLLARGEILLADGQIQRAVDDLEKVLEQKLPADIEKRAKNRLYDGLTDLLGADFGKASVKYLDAYRQLCHLGDTPGEIESRKARYFRIVGHGREAQGNLIEAFHNYKEFGSLKIHRETGGVASLEDPSHKTPVDVWLRGRIAAMFAKATPEQRAPLEAKIADEWKLVEAKKEIESIRAFVGMFDTPFAVGREARLRLAEAIIERNDQANFLEAELSLHQLRGRPHRQDPKAGGRALAALALLEEKKNTAEAMQAATGYYRQLALEFPDAPIRGDKTGKDLLNHLAGDKRILPYLEDSSASWISAKLSARTGTGVASSFGVNANVIQHNVLHSEGEPSPFMSRHRLMLETQATNAKISLIDPETGKPRWGPITLPAAQPQMPLQISHIYHPNQANQAANPNARFRFYQSAGRLIVFQVGIMAYCVDADQGRVLWQQQLVESLAQRPNTFASLQVDHAEGVINLSIMDQFNGIQKTHSAVGHVGAVQSNYVAIMSHNGLSVLDPIRGTIQWKKSDIPNGSRVYGDDSHVFVVDGGEGGFVGATRVFRASDGEPVNAPNFSREFVNRVRVVGGRILTTGVVNGQNSLRLYDIASGKDVWSKPMPTQATVAATDDPNLIGWIEPKGELVALDAATGAELLKANVLQGRVAEADIVNLHRPLLLADGDRFYVALNRSVEAKVGGGVIMNNFQTGIRSRLVNGWIVALHRKDGVKQVRDKAVPFAKGDLAWHSDRPIMNQMLVVEQFERMPILLFTGRHNHVMPVGNVFQSSTIALRKSTGFVSYDSGTSQSMNNNINNIMAQFVDLRIDPRQGAVTVLGNSNSTSVQFYIDDGRKVEVPAGMTITTQLIPPPERDLIQPAQPPVGRVFIRQGIPAVPEPVPEP